MKFWSFLIYTFIQVVSTTEIDIDIMNQTNGRVIVGDRMYLCKIKNPPLSHSWAYECDSGIVTVNNSPRLRRILTKK